ncbi:MAG: HAMP domain-containing sensor histidine kinase [Gemmatimonadota bacterium]
MAGSEASFSVVSDSLDAIDELSAVLELGVVSLDRELIIRGWNRWLAAASGVEAKAVLGRHMLDVFPALRGSLAEDALRRSLSGETTVWAHHFHRYLLPLPSPAGHPSFAQMQQSARVMPLSRDGEIDGVVVLVQDVTERVAREEELRRALREAEVASEAKSNFLASMSHELRTPLGAIIGYMDLLASEMVGPIAPLQKNYLGRVKAAAQHLVSVVEEILTFSRLEAHKDSLLLENVDVVALVASVKEMFEPMTAAKGLALAVTAPQEPLTLQTDVTKLRQILINLVGNAVKFTDDGRVEMELTADDRLVRFHIRDTGPGITAADLERIFDPFTQLDQSLTRSKGGTGLGLSVSRRLAHLLGGELLVESKTGQGTNFVLCLPANSSRDAARDAVRS